MSIIFKNNFYGNGTSVQGGFRAALFCDNKICNLLLALKYLFMNVIVFGFTHTMTNRLTGFKTYIYWIEILVSNTWVSKINIKLRKKNVIMDLFATKLEYLCQKASISGRKLI